MYYAPIKIHYAPNRKGQHSISLYKITQGELELVMDLLEKLNMMRKEGTMPRPSKEPHPNTTVQIFKEISENHKRLYDNPGDD